MPVLLVIIAAALWGISYIFTKIALQEISTVAFLFFRYAVATLFLFPIFLFRSIPLSKELIKKGISLSLLQAILIFTQAIGLETISASLSSFVGGFYIVFVLIIRAILTRKLPNILDLVASILCLVGLGLLTHSLGEPDPIGLGYTFISALFFAIYIYVFEKYINTDADLAFSLTFLQVVGIMLFAASLCLCNRHIFQLPSIGITWSSIIVSGLGSSSLAYWLVGKAQPKLGAFKVSIILMLEPVFATIFASFGLHEKLCPTSFLGIAIILVGITMIHFQLKEG